MTSVKDLEDSNMLTDKESILKRIRNALTHKIDVHNQEMDRYMAMDVAEPIPNLVQTFIDNFRKAGGYYVPCTTQNVILNIERLFRSQKYRCYLSTHTFFSKFLENRCLAPPILLKLNRHC